MTDRDPGLFVERTALAWDRTTLALAGAAALTGRAGTWIAAGVLGVLAVLSAVVAARGHVLGRAMTHRLLAVGVAVAGVAALIP